MIQNHKTLSVPLATDPEDIYYVWSPSNKLTGIYLVSGGAVYDMLDKVVRVEDGKGLSTNDFTDAYKNQVDVNKQDILDLITNLESYSVVAALNKAVKVSTTAGVSTVDFVIDPSDKVLSQSTTGLLSTLSLTHDSDTGVVSLKGVGDVVISSFNLPLDMVLDSVELVVDPAGQPPGTYIKFIFETASGKEPIYLNVTDLIVVYTAGNAGINVSTDFKISLVVDPASNLEVNTNGIGIKAGFQLLSDAQATKIANSITEVVTTDTTHIELHGKGTTADPLSATAVGLATAQSVSDLKNVVLELDGNIKTYEVLGAANNAVDVQTTVLTKRTVVQLKIDPVDQVLTQSSAGLLANLAIQKITTPATGMEAQYKLVGEDGTTAIGVTIDIPKAQSFTDINLIYKADQAAVDLADDRGTTLTLGNSYLCVELTLSTGSVWLYRDVTDLVDTYASGNAAIDVTDYKISLVIDPTSHLEINTNGLGIENGYQLMTDAQVAKLIEALTEVITEDTRHIAFSGKGTAANPLKAEPIDLVEEVLEPDPTTLVSIYQHSNYQAPYNCGVKAPNGLIYFGTQASTIIQIDETTDTATVMTLLPGAVANDRINCCIVSKAGDTYFGGVKGLWKLDPSSGSFIHVVDNLTIQGQPVDINIETIVEHSDGSIYFTNTMSGIYRINADNSVDHIYYRIGTPSSQNRTYLAEKILNGEVFVTLYTNYAILNVNGTLTNISGASSTTVKFIRGTDGIIYCYRRSVSPFPLFKIEQIGQSYQSSQVIGMYADLVCTYKNDTYAFHQGIYKLNKNTGLFETFQTIGGYYVVMADTDVNGDLILFTRNEGEWILDMSKNEFVRLTPRTDYGGVAVKDSGNSFYIGGNGDYNNRIWKLTLGNDPICARRYKQWVDISGKLREIDGLQADVNVLRDELDTIEQEKLSKVITQDSSTVTFTGEGTQASPLTAIASTTGGVEEAPNDNKVYARQNEDWTDITDTLAAVTTIQTSITNIEGDISDIQDELDGFVKLESATTQVIDSNLTLTKDSKLMLQRSNGAHENAISIGIYGTYEQEEIGSEADPTCLNHNAKASDGTVVGKNIIVNYKDELGVNQVDAVAYLSDIPTVEPLETEDTTHIHLSGAGSLIDPLKATAVDLVEEVSPPSGSEGIVPTNLITGGFQGGGLSADETLYFFSSSGLGIWKLDPTTEDIISTNDTTGWFRTSVQSAAGDLYFGTASSGILKLNSSTGNIDQTNVTTGTYPSGEVSSDGVLYFCGSGSGGTLGIRKLDSVTGNIIPTNITSGTFNYCGLSSDGTLYFCGSAPSPGIWKLDSNTGDIIPTNVITGGFNYCGQSADGTLYFLGNSTTGIWKLDSNTGDIVPTNVIDKSFIHCGITSDGVLYFCGAAGIYKLDIDGSIVEVSSTINTRYCILAVNNDFYFCSVSSGIYKLDSVTGNIIPTNITSGGFNSGVLSSDGMLYFCSDSEGLFKLNPSTGLIYARKYQEWLPIDEQIAKANVIQLGGSATEFLAKDGQYHPVAAPTDVVKSTDVQIIKYMTLADYHDVSFTPVPGVLYLLS